MKRYIIALLAKDPKQFTDYAKAHFTGLSEGYMIGERSHPHVTLAHFNGEQDDYEIVREFLAQIKNPPQPNLLGLVIGRDFSDPDKWWTSLTVQKTKELQKLHHLVITYLSTLNLGVLTAHGEFYDPHLTLGRFQLQRVDLSLPAFEGCEFVLSISEGDAFGQVIKVLKTF